MTTSVVNAARSSGCDVFVHPYIHEFNISGKSVTAQLSFHQAAPQMAECPAVSKGKPNVMTPTTTHIAALT